MAEAEVRQIGAGWVKLLRNASIAQIVLIIVTQVVTMQVIPPLIVFAVLLGVGLYLLSTKTKAAGLMLGIVSLLHIALSAPFFITSLVHPESLGDFSLGWFTVVAGVLGVIAGIPVWRQSPPSKAPRTIGLTAVGLCVVLFAVSAFATVSREDEEAQSGDLVVVAEDVEFEPEELTGESGSVTVHIDNKDQFRHTFTIDDLDVNAELAAGKGTRVTFEAEPGEYDYTCAVPGHEDMEGTLTLD